MDIIVYILVLLLIGLDAYLIRKTYTLEKKLNEKSTEHQKRLSDAGDAITDTLRVAFDNLKRNSNDHQKINAKLTEYNSRIHRLEQHIGRTEKEVADREEDIDNKESVIRKNKKQ